MARNASAPRGGNAVPSRGVDRLPARRQGHGADHAALPLSDDGLTVNRIMEIEDWSVMRGINLKRMENTAWCFEPL
jgi:hypothetical protein